MMITVNSKYDTMNKKDLLSNLREYSTAEIASAIKSGQVTLYELSKTGQMTPLMRKRIEKAMEEQDTVSETVAEDTNEPMPCADDVDGSAPVVAEHIQVSNDDNTSDDGRYQQMVSLDQLINNDAAQEATKTVQNKSNQTFTSPNTELPINKTFNRPFSFKGRIRRTEYGVSFILYLIWSLVNNVFNRDPYAPTEIITFLLLTLIPMSWFILAQGCKRCHDRGNNGWYQLIPFYWLILLFGDGEKGLNKYGNNPKEM